MATHHTHNAARLDNMLRAGDPIHGRVPASSGVETALELIGAAIVGQPRRQRRRRLARTPRASLAFAATILSLAGAAAATTLFVNAHTGQYPKNRAEVRMGGPGEYLNVNGTNFRQVALLVSDGVPYPAGYATWREWVVRMYGGPQPCPPASPRGCKMEVSTGALRGWFAMSAFTAWVVDWREAMLAGDQARAVRDAQAIGGALRWNAVTAEDPHPSISVPGDMGTTHTTLFGWMIPFIHAVHAGDRPRVDALILSARYGGNFHTYPPPSVQSRLLSEIARGSRS
jgi:hypothetical protein